MKKVFYLLLFLGFSLLANAQKIYDLNRNAFDERKQITIPSRDVEETSEGVYVTYHFNNVALFEDDLFKTCSFVKIDGFQLIQEEGKPAILTRWDPFVVFGENATVSLVDSSYIDIPLELSPARPSLINSSSEKYSLDNVKPITPYSGFYPISAICSKKSSKYRNFPLLEIEISPFQYDYEKKIVRFFRDIKYKVNYGTSDISNKDIEAKNTDKQTVSQVFSNIITNRSTLNKHYEPKAITSSSGQVSTSHYLIITVPKYASSANRFAEWKRTLGFNVDVEIRSSWVSDSVKRVVLDSYTTNNTQYLLIIGGNNDVPGVYQRSESLYTDVYYGCTDSISSYLSPVIFSYLTPDIFRGRLLVNTPEESETVINKIINYEKNPPLDSNFYKTGMNSAFFEDDLHTGMEEYGYVYTSEIIRNRLLELGKTINRVYYADEETYPKYWSNYYAGGGEIPDSLKKPLYTWDGCAANITSCINNGAFFVFHRDHGEIHEWWLPQYTNEDLAYLNNGDRLPVMFSICCLTGKYDEDNCFCESMLNKENGGCVGIFGATQVSYPLANDILAKGIFDAIWPSSSFFPHFPTSGTQSGIQVPVYRLGQILDQALYRVKYSISDVTKGKTFLLYHCFGDPGMMIYTEKPTPFSGASIERQNGIINVNTGGETATITFYNRATGGVVNYLGTTQTFADDNDIVVCISAHNKIPYISYGNLYIQNETLTQGGYYVADTIKVGANVTSSKPQGEVIFQQGDYHLTGNEIEFHPGTTVSLGTTLEIKNNQ